MKWKQHENTERTLLTNNKMSETTTLNLCLGLRDKKEIVHKLIEDNNIDILCMQETEIPNDFPINMLTFKGYHFENENNNCKSFCGIYVSNNVPFVLRNDLEIPGVHAIIIDLKDSQQTRIINVYCSFNPLNNQAQRENFISLMELLSRNVNTNMILIGDFHLDYRVLRSQTLLWNTWRIPTGIYANCKLPNLVKDD